MRRIRRVEEKGLVSGGDLIRREEAGRVKRRRRCVSHTRTPVDVNVRKWKLLSSYYYIIHILATIIYLAAFFFSPFFSSFLRTILLFESSFSTEPVHTYL